MRTSLTFPVGPVNKQGWLVLRTNSPLSVATAGVPNTLQSRRTLQKECKNRKKKAISEFEWNLDTLPPSEPQLLDWIPLLLSWNVLHIYQDSLLSESSKSINGHNEGTIIFIISEGSVHMKLPPSAITPFTNTLNIYTSNVVPEAQNKMPQFARVSSVSCWSHQRNRRHEHRTL